jgi:hypothetical protein
MRASPWSHRLIAGGLSLLPPLLGAAIYWFAPIEVEWLKTAGALITVFPFGFFVLMGVIGISGVHGGSLMLMVIVPLAVNLGANFFLIHRWLAKREST